jgi:hypothetical protein
MMCVCVTVTAESQQMQELAELEGAIEAQPEVTTTTRNEPENHDVPNGGYNSMFLEVL